MPEKVYIMLFAKSNRQIDKLKNTYADAVYYCNKFGGKGKYYYVEDTAENKLKAKELKLSIAREETKVINRILNTTYN